MIQTILEFLKELITAIFSKKIDTPVEPVIEPSPTPEPQPVEPPKPVPVLPRQKLYMVAFSLLGTDVSPNDLAPDEYGCAESWCNVIKKAFPEEKSFVITLSTIGVYKYLINSPLWEEVTSPQYGDTIISVTGTGNGVLSNGHVGIVGKNRIMSNNSRTGKWDDYFTLDMWDKYYHQKGGFKAHYFRRK